MKVRGFAALGAMVAAWFGCVSAATAQLPLLDTYAGSTGTLTQNPSPTSAGIGQPVLLSWKHRGVGLDGTWRAPWAVAQLAANPSDPAALGDPSILDVRLATGEYAPTEVDINLPCIGPDWTVGRTRRPLGATTGSIHGAGWTQASQIQLVVWDRTGTTDDVIYLCYGGDRFAEFRRVNSSTYRGVNGAAGAISSANLVAQLGGPLPAVLVYTYHDPTGITIDFLGSNATYTDDQNVSYDGRWQVWRITDAEGYRAYVGHATNSAQAMINGYDAAGRITTAYDSAGRMYTYSYASFGGAPRLSRVEATLGGGLVAAVDYDYYTQNDGDGSIGYLKFVTTTVPTSVVGGSPGPEIKHQTFYRYWTSTSGAQTGFASGPSGSVRMIAGSEAVRAGIAGNSGSFPTLTDSQWATYGATRLGYDSGLVASAAGAGLTSQKYAIRYEYPSSAVSSTNGYDNVWASRTVVRDTYGSGTLKRATTTYFDEVAQSLSTVTSSDDPVGNGSPTSSPIWASFVERSSIGTVTKIGTPASVSSYTLSTGAVALRASSGLVQHFPRFSVDGSTNATLIGFVEKIQHSVGSSGSKIDDRLYGYRTISSGTRPCKALTGYTIYRPLIESVTQYPTAGGSGEATLSTYYLPSTTTAPNGTSGALTIDWIKTSYPAVGWSQHGSGIASVSAVAMARNGRITHVRARGDHGTPVGSETPVPGAMTYRTYDSSTGLVTSVVDDASSSTAPGAPSGFPLPANNPASRVTSYQYDPQGRITQMDDVGYQTVSYAYSCLSDGHPTTTRGILVGSSYASPADFSVTNLAGKVVSTGKIVADSDASFGAVATLTGSPETWINTSTSNPMRPLAQNVLRSPTVSELDASGLRVLQVKRYFNTPSTGAGTSAANYDQSAWEYDSRGVLVKSTDPTGTFHEATTDALDRTVTITRGTGSGSQLIATYTYDGGAAGGNSLVTQVSRPVGGTSGSRVTSFLYDEFGQVLATANPESPHTMMGYDNLGRRIAAGMFAGAPSDFLTYAAGATPTGSHASRLGFALASYDPLGQPFKHEVVMGSSAGAGSGVLTETFYDSTGRTALRFGAETVQYEYADSGGCGCSASKVSIVAKAEFPTTYAEAMAVQSSDIVLAETHTLWSTDRREEIGYAYVRRHPILSLPDITIAGPLTTSSFLSLGTVNYDQAPYGRVSSVFVHRDALHRPIRTVDFGNAGYEPYRTGSSSTSWATYATATLTDGTTPYLSARVGFYDYDQNGFVGMTANERGDSTTTERDEFGRARRESRLVGNGDLPIVSVSNSCKPQELKQIEYEKGRLRSVCLSIDPCPDMPSQLMKLVYPDDGDSSYPLGASDSIIDNNALRTVFYSVSHLAGSSSATADRIDFARNIVGELSARSDNAGVVSYFTRDGNGRELTRDYVIPSGTDALGLPLVDDAVQGLIFTRDSFGRVVDTALFTGGPMTEGYSGFGHDIWGCTTDAEQRFWLPDGSGGGVDPLALLDPSFSESMRIQREWQMITGGGSGEQTFWRGPRLNQETLPGWDSSSANNDIRYHYIRGEGPLGMLIGLPLPGDREGGVNVDEIVGRPTQQDYWERTKWIATEQVDYLGTDTPSNTNRPSSGMEKMHYLAPGLGLPDGNKTTGLSRWDEHEVDVWRQCAGLSPCAPWESFVGTPVHEKETRVDPRDLCACNLKLQEQEFTDPRGNRSVEPLCSSVARGFVELNGREALASGISLLPPEIDRTDFWLYDDRGNPTKHSRFIEQPTGLTPASLPSEDGDFVKEYTVNRADQATHVETTDKTLIPATVEQFYDQRGNLRSDGTRYFQYNAENQLTQVRTAASGGATIQALFSYDALGRRTTARYAGASGAITAQKADLYVYDPEWRVTAVVQATPEVVSGSPTGNFTAFIRERYVYCLDNPDTPLFREVDSDGDGSFDKQQYFLGDRQGSTIGIMERFDTDSDGVPDSDAKLIARVSYTMYGEPRIYRPTDFDRDGEVESDDLAGWQDLLDAYEDNVSGSEAFEQYLDFNRDGVVDGNDASDFMYAWFDEIGLDGSQTIGEYLGNLPLYGAYWWDAELKLYHVRHRVYDPYSARWLQRDPIGLAGGDNLYGYVGNEPWSFMDPMGLDPRLNPTERDFRNGYYDVQVGKGSSIYRRYFYKNGSVTGSVLWSYGNNGGNLYKGQQVFSEFDADWAAANQELFSTIHTVGVSLRATLSVVQIGNEMIVRVALTPVDVAWSAYELAHDPTDWTNWAGMLPLFGKAIKKVSVVMKDAKGVARTVEVTEAEVKLLAEGKSELRFTSNRGEVVAKTECRADEAAAVLTASKSAVLADELAAAATRARNKIGPGSGTVYGTHVHTAFEAEVKTLGRGNVRTEVSYLNGAEVKRGTLGSVRLDVVEFDANGQILNVFDLKTGSATLTPARIRQIQSHLPASAVAVPVHEVRP